MTKIVAAVNSYNSTPEKTRLPWSKVVDKLLDDNCNGLALAVETDNDGDQTHYYLEVVPEWIEDVDALEAETSDAFNTVFHQYYMEIGKKGPSDLYKAPLKAVVVAYEKGCVEHYSLEEFSKLVA